MTTFAGLPDQRPALSIAGTKMALSASDKSSLPQMYLDMSYQYVNVKRISEGDLDDDGLPAQTWAEVEDHQNIKADIQPIHSSMEFLKEMIQGQEEKPDYVIFFLKGASVLVGDKVEADDDGADAYILTAVRDWGSQITTTAKKI